MVDMEESSKKYCLDLEFMKKFKFLVFISIFSGIFFVIYRKSKEI